MFYYESQKLITAVKGVMSYPAFVCLCVSLLVCLSVILLATSGKNY